MNWAFSIPANSSKTSVSSGEAYTLRASDRDPGCRHIAGRPLQMGTLELGSLRQDSDRFPGLEVGTT